MIPFHGLFASDQELLASSLAFEYSHAFLAKCADLGIAVTTLHDEHILECAAETHAELDAWSIGWWAVRMASMPRLAAEPAMETVTMKEWSSRL